MTQLEILKLASHGIFSKMNREKEIIRKTEKRTGFKNRIAERRLEKLTQEADEISKMIYEEEQK